MVYFTIIYKNNSSFALLLMTYNNGDRVDMYNDIILWWLNHSCYDIFIVDSGNYPFCNTIEKNERIQILHFEQKQFLKEGSSTDFELLSMKQAFAYFDFKQYDFVIKLTAKYKLPKLQNTLRHLDLSDTQLIVQSTKHQHDKHLNSELFVIKSDLLFEVLNDLYQSNSIQEKNLYETSKKYNVIHLPLLRNVANYPRGDKILLKRV